MFAEDGPLRDRGGTEKATGIAVAPEHPAGLRAAFAITGGVRMGATVAAVTGAFLVRLLRHPRTGPPQSA